MSNFPEISPESLGGGDVFAIANQLLSTSAPAETTAASVVDDVITHTQQSTTGQPSTNSYEHDGVISMPRIQRQKPERSDGESSVFKRARDRLERLIYVNPDELDEGSEALGTPMTDLSIEELARLGTAEPAPTQPGIHSILEGPLEGFSTTTVAPTDTIGTTSLLDVVRAIKDAEGHAAETTGAECMAAIGDTLVTPPADISIVVPEPYSVPPEPLNEAATFSAPVPDLSRVTPAVIAQGETEYRGTLDEGDEGYGFVSPGYSALSLFDTDGKPLLSFRQANDAASGYDVTGLPIIDAGKLPAMFVTEEGVPLLGSGAITREEIDVLALITAINQITEAHRAEDEAHTATLQEIRDSTRSNLVSEATALVESVANNPDAFVAHFHAGVGFDEQSVVNFGPDLELTTSIPEGMYGHAQARAPIAALEGILAGKVYTDGALNQPNDIAGALLSILRSNTEALVQKVYEKPWYSPTGFIQTLTSRDPFPSALERTIDDLIDTSTPEFDLAKMIFPSGTMMATIQDTGKWGVQVVPDAVLEAFKTAGSFQKYHEKDGRVTVAGLVPHDDGAVLLHADHISEAMKLDRRHQPVSLVGLTTDAYTSMSALLNCMPDIVRTFLNNDGFPYTAALNSTLQPPVVPTLEIE